MPATFFNDRYRLDGELGGVGMGAVYCAYDTLLMRNVAIKVLDKAKEIGLDSKAHACLLHEARLAAQLSHRTSLKDWECRG